MIRLCYIKSILVLLMVSLIVSACATPSQQNLSLVDTVKPEDVPTVDPSNTDLYQAQQNYTKWCAHCHGWAGDGQPQITIENAEARGYHTVPRHDSNGHTWQHPDQVLFEVVKYGVQSPTNLYPMSSFDEQLTDGEINAIIDYIKVWWTDEQHNHQAQLTTQFEEDNPFWAEENITDED